MGSICLLLAAASPGLAAITTTGSILDNGNIYVGYTAAGTLQVNGTSVLDRNEGYIGYNAAATGTATITGSGAKWTFSFPNESLYVGYSGTGTLNIQAGGQVIGGTYPSPGSMYVAYNLGSTGTVTVTGAGSSWTNPYEPINVGYSGNGTLDIEPGGQVTCGVVSTQDKCILGCNSGSQGTVIVNGQDANWTCNARVYVGYNGNGNVTVEAGGQITSWGAILGENLSSHGTAKVTGSGSVWTLSGLNLGSFDNSSGTLTVEAGGHVNSSDSTLGLNGGTSGTVTVTGAGSMWTTNTLYVGTGGSGTVDIEAGGQASSTTAYIGYYAKQGRVTVTGAGSVWNVRDYLYVGANYSGQPPAADGRLTVADGGKVTATSLKIEASPCAVRLVVDGNAMVVLGSATSDGSVSNKGTISLYVNAFLAPGAYMPITPYPGRGMSWTGTGSCNAYGGSWGAYTYVLTVPAVTPRAAGVSGAITSGQRLLITDSNTGRQVGASFGALDNGGYGQKFGASLMSVSELNALRGTAGFDGVVLAGWDFTTNFTGDQVLLAFGVGLGQQGIAVWHYDGKVWTPYAADMLTYDSNGVASFAVTSFSGYAVTAVPEPATLSLLALGGLALLPRRR
jgi:T5SS/PEP-CTERM-associated repeat protein